ncbi:MAG: hypothetical protein N3A67_05195 [Ignavibacteria bacterium]|nr:hypothetical protein [Ignavibacteria bacterium]
MRIRLNILFICLLFICSEIIFAGNASLFVSDTSLMIGSHAEIKLFIQLPQNYSAQIPNINYPDNVILLKRQIDTTYDAGILKIANRDIITSFVESTYIIPETKIIFTNNSNNNISIETTNPLKILYLNPIVDTNKPSYNFFDSILVKKNTLIYHNNSYLYILFFVFLLLLVAPIMRKYLNKIKTKNNHVKILQILLNDANNHPENQLIISINRVLLNYITDEIGLNKSEINTNNIKMELSNRFEINDLTIFIDIKNKIDFILYNNGQISKDEVILMIKELIRIFGKYTK